MVANCKMIIGEAREKFATIAGPQGGGSLNGTAMKAEAQTQMDALIGQLVNYVDGSQPLTWVIG
jgi:GTPase involved in cell partitioning and DNA repair